MYHEQNKRQELSLCYYPTSIMVVSDKPDYMHSLHDVMQGGFLYQRFQQAQDAVRHIIDAIRDTLFGQFTCSYEQSYDQSVELFQKTLQTIIDRRMQATRFAEPSIILFDARSPDWAQACQELRNKGVQRVLHSQSKTELLDAFNAGLIDYAMREDDRSDILQDLQQQYFRRRCEHLLPQLHQQSPWFTDKAFKQYWQTLYAQYTIIEYYFVTQPEGFIFVSANGQTHRLVIYDEVEIKDHIDCAQDLGAPESIIQALTSRTSVPYFETKDGLYHQDIGEPDRCLYDATRITGCHIYYCAVIQAS